MCFNDLEHHRTRHQRLSAFAKGALWFLDYAGFEAIHDMPLGSTQLDARLRCAAVNLCHVTLTQNMPQTNGS